MENAKRSRFSDSTLTVLLILAALLPFANIFANGFVYDDKIQILDNPYILSFRHLGKILTTSVWSFAGPQGATNYYRPVMTVGYLLCFKMFGAGAWGFHLASLLLHAGITVLVFLVMRKLFADRWAAFVAGLLFALHPIHTEAVAWAAAVTELEVAAFFLLAFWFFLGAAKSQGTTSPRWLAAMAVAYLLALLSKEQALMLPPLALVYEHFYRADRTETSVAQKLARYGPLWLLAGVYVALRVVYLGGFAPVVQHADLTPAQTVLSALALTGEYLGKLLWPVHLNAFYPFHKSTSFLELPVAAGIGALLICAVLFAIFWRRQRPASFAILWILVLLLPVLNARYLAANAFAERYLYLPSVGFCWLLGWGGVGLWRRAGEKRMARVALVVLLAVVLELYLWRIVTRNRVWHDDVALYTATLAAAPDAYPIRLNLGAVYWDEGKVDLAGQEWQKAVDAGYSTPPLWNDLGLLYTRKKDYPRAITMFEKAIHEQPQYTDAHLNLGVAYEKMGEAARAEAEYQRAVELAPLNVHAHNRLGLLYLSQERASQAEEQFRISLAAAPNVVAFDGLGEVLRHTGRDGEAEQAFRRALILNGADVRARLNLAELYAGSGRREQAIEQYRAVLKHEPNNARARTGVENLEGHAETTHP